MMRVSSRSCVLLHCGLRRVCRAYRPQAIRTFHASRPQLVVKPFLLADIGEGIRECEIIQWFVEPGARVEEWDKLCEVQSDKASVEITNRYAGVIKKLHYEAGEMAKVGKPLMDIDIQADVKEEDLEGVGQGPSVQKIAAVEPEPTQVKEKVSDSGSTKDIPASKVPSGKHSTLATPAVRHLTKDLEVNLCDVIGTGRDGRVLKEDIYKFAEQRDSKGSNSTGSLVAETGPQTETITPLSNMQYQMFKTMTRSLSIPHFLFADEIDFSQLTELRARVNRSLTRSTSPNDVEKISYLPFVIKAVSMSLNKYPILNARVEIASNDSSGKPSLIFRSNHNVGVAMDTPQGLMVPVIKNVGALSVLSVARELSRLQAQAMAGRLSSHDLAGGTITVSNIGNIGGTYVSPVIVDREVAILGIGKMRTVPAFAGDGTGAVTRRQICNFSWSADHRVVDGATMARAAEVVRGLVEEPDTMLIHLR